MIFKKKIILILVATMFLIGTSQIVTAETDGSGDVYHHKASSDGTTWVYEESSVAKNNVDIKEVSYSVSGTTLTVTMEINGTIQSSMDHAYYIYFNTSDATYIFSWTTQGIAIGYDWDYYNDSSSVDPSNIMNYYTTGTFTSEGSTLTGTIELLGSSTPTNFWAYAMEYSVDFSEETNIGQVEWWGDYWPNSYGPWNQEDGGTHEQGENGEDQNQDDSDNGEDAQDGGSDSDKGTPGFELVAFIAAISIAVFVLRKKRK